MAHFNIDLDLDKSQAVGQVVRARVGDVESCVIAATIYDHGSEVDLEGRSARFCMLKPDRTVIEDDGCEVDGSTVTHTLGSQATAAAGVAELAYFEILEGSTVIDSTQSFRLVIEPDAEGAGSGPSEDYISRVDAAVEAANDAAEAATGAAQSATAAAGAANDAAEGATQAAQTANAAAEAASAAAEAARGNVLKGTLGPDPILSADDAYATTPRRLTVYGKTRQNLWVNPNGTNAGVTVTANANGSITLSGVKAGSAGFSIVSGAIYTVKPNTTYVAFVDKAVNGSSDSKISLAVAYMNPAESGNVHFGITSQKSIIFTTTSSFDYVHCDFYVGPDVTEGTTFSGTYRVMLREATAEEKAQSKVLDTTWCPPGLNSVDELSVVTKGKNLGSYASIMSSSPMVKGGVTATLLEDGGIKLNGTADGTEFSHFTLGYVKIPSGVTVTLSGLAGSGYPSGLSIRWSDVVYGFQDINSSVHTKTFATSSTCQGTFVIVAYNGTTLNNVVVYPQLELGSTATDYEPPQVTTTPIDLDGHTLNSLPDGTCDELTVDADGSVMLVQRVCAVEYDASDFNDSNTEYTEAVLTKRYAGGVDFSANRQLSDFATVGNADTTPGHPLVGAYTSYSDGVLRGGTGNAEASSSAQSTAFKAMLGSQTWHHLYKLATPETIELPPVTLPTLPAPTVNVFADAESSGTGYAMGPDVGMEYERDVNIAFEKLEAEVSALNILEATNG